MTAEARMSPGPQHMQALQRANAVRLARAELKRRVAIGEVGAADVILDAPWEAESMTVSDLLTSQRRWGHTRCRKFLQCTQLLAASGAPRTAPERAEERVEGLTPMLAGVA